MRRRKPLMRSGGDSMIVGWKDACKLFGIAIVACCAVFVCALFLNYNTDIITVKDAITSPQGMVIYDAQVACGKVVAIVSGGCLAVTSVILLLFYIKNYIDTHGKELGILKALGYSRIQVAKHFWVFGCSVFIGCILGFLGAFLYLPTFYEVQNAEKLLPDITPQFHLWTVICLIVVPTLCFMGLSVFYAFLKLKKQPLHLLKEYQTIKRSTRHKDDGDMPYLQELKRNTLRSRKILVFFIAFSAFCFSAMTQMSMSMKTLASESFAWMMISIGLILAFMTLFLSLTSVIYANTKTVAMMKVFGYSRRECSRAILSCYRPISYIGFLIGTAYQYILLKVMVTFVFVNLEGMPDYHFDGKACIISLAIFLASYELIMYCYARRINKLSVKSVMLES